jgi:hypothetical protein
LALFILSAAARPVEPTTGQCSSVVVASPQALRVRDRFSARRILDVEFSATLRKRISGGRHVLRFRVFTPKGHLYQELAVPFSTAEPVGVAADRGPRRPRLTSRMPVGGTSISTASLYGRWKVVPHLDGNLQACGTGTSFTIVP